MADHINPNIKNRLSQKEILKRSAALTLLLSTVACLSGNTDVDTMIWLVCPALLALIGFVGHLKIVTGKNYKKKK